MQEERYSNYISSLKQKYNAVCFDIDGTLTEKDSKRISSRAISLIASLLNRYIPVLFITGRGETGLVDLKNDIYEPLLNEYNVNPSEMKRIYALINDGARLFYTKSIEDGFLKEQVYISKEKELDELKEIDNLINNLIISNNLKDIIKVTYSYDIKNNNILNVRIVFNTSDESVINKIYNMIKEIINKQKFDSIHITRGVYKNNQVLQIGTSSKDKAITIAEEIIGVPKNSIIRIGDCGDVIGSDYLMLNCRQGYSVGKLSDDINSCFPIYNKDKKIIKGVDATIELINVAKILPTVCLEKASKYKYIHEYASVEKKIIYGRNSFLNHFNSLINYNFETINGIYGLVDEYSGSIKIPMYEWELLEDNPLKDFWSTKYNGNLGYAMRDNDNYLLRGSKTYYYFLANRYSVNGNDNTNFNDVYEWYQNYIKFFYKAIEATQKSIDILSKINKKFILGILDNARNVLLIIINHLLYKTYPNENVILDLPTDDSIKVAYDILIIVEKMMSDLCFNTSKKIDKTSIIKLISSVYEVICNDFKKIENSNINYSREYRTYREMDNFIENYITIYLNNQKNKINKQISTCGLCYGGLELPILYKTINDGIKKSFVLKFNSKVSGYSNKQLMDLRKFDIYEFGGIIGADHVDTPLYLLDDNILTGKTMQLAINALYDYNISIENICIVRYPSINRIDQMFMQGHTAVDYRLFFDYITGLCFSSHYSWRDENENFYQDSLGIFDLNRNKIIECLIKNHDYSDISEVSEHKRRLVR